MHAKAIPTIELPLISCEETAMLLRRNLGASKVWSDFLADMRRGKSDGLKGLTLHPYCVVGKIPMYHPVDIAGFITQARELIPSLGPEPLVSKLCSLPDIEGLPWTMRRAVPVPVAEP